MRVKTALLVVCVGVTSSALAQSAEKRRLLIINASAIALPKPEYTQELQSLCAYGKVEVQVLIGTDGRVEDAKPISGDPILYDSAVAAVQKAKFRLKGDLPAIKHTGLVVYNFPAEKKCFDAGVVNKKAIKLPTPKVILAAGAYKDDTIHVRVVINELGDVIAARAIDGHPLFRVPCEAAAMKAKFSPTNDVGRIRVKGIITYKISNGRINI
jgi:hypothetical protein